MLREKQIIIRQKAEIQIFESNAKRVIEIGVNKPHGWPIIDQFNHFRRFFFINKIMKKYLYDSNDKKIIINVGAGGGMEAEFLIKSNSNLNIIAIDISNINCICALNRSKKKNFEKNFNPICADGSKLPLRNDIGQIAFFYDSLHHIPNYKKALKEVDQSLKKNSYIFLIEPFISKILNYIIIKKLKYQNPEYFGFVTYKFLLGEFKKFLMNLNYNFRYVRKLWDFYPKLVHKIIKHYPKIFKVFKMPNKILTFASRTIFYDNAIVLFQKKIKS